MQNILVTGANGQLGSEIKNIKNKFNNYSFIFTDIEELDITNLDATYNFVENNNISLIINCAAYTAVDKAEKDAETAYKINVIGAENLKIAAQSINIPFIHISTDYVFDGKNFKPYTEDDITNPNSIYGKTKLEGEEKVSDYDKTITIRTSWLYSVFGNNFVKTIIKIANQNPTIKVVFDQIGTPTNAADLALAVLKIASDSLDTNAVKSGIYHFSNEGVCSWYDFAKTIVDFKKINCKIYPVGSEEFPRPAPRPFYSVLNKSKIKTTFDLSIPNWVDSLKTALNNM
ncbi:MAG: dTDP-4-dehydrorhamnose reductase [Bacteroidales bacterium]|nr:dTDP-4-dehydrorhamnose reductase [Bacteroidales bacterium]